MASSIKTSIDTRGDWRPPYPEDLRMIDKFLLGCSDDRLKQDISSMKLVKEWFCGVACVAKVRSIAPEKDYAGYGHMVSIKAYDLPMEVEQLVSDVFELSLHYRILGVNPSIATIYVVESNDGTTNITDEVVCLLEKTLSQPVTTLADEINGMGVVEDD